MKKLIAVFLIVLPSAAHAMGRMHGMGGGGSCGHLATVLYAVMAALGYWIVQHAHKETANCVKRAGAIVGTILITVGLLGLLCGVAGHIRKSMKSCAGKCHMEMTDPDMAGKPDCEMMKMGHGQMKTVKGK